MRVNGVESGLMGADLEAVLGGSCDSSLAGGGVGGIPDSIMLPKCDSVEHLHLVKPHPHFLCVGDSTLFLFCFVFCSWMHPWHFTPMHCHAPSPSTSS